MATGLTIIDSLIASGIPKMIVPAGVVDVGANRYTFFLDTGNDLCYRKSTNRGKSWNTKVVIAAGTYDCLSIWYDRWTPGDSGTEVHIAATDQGIDDVQYFSLDTASDTVGNGGVALTIFAGISTSTTGGEISIAKARGGNLYCGFDMDGGTETGFYRSIDGGTTWAVRTNINEATSDYYILVPGNDADNQDMWAVYWDRSADEITLKVFDDSANTWSETLISASMIDVSKVSAHGQMAICIRPSDNHLLLAAWSDRDTVTADLKTWDINGSASITAKTNVLTDTDDCSNAVLSINPHGRIYCTYVGKADGSENVPTAVTVNQKYSDDGMATWSGEYPVHDDQTWDISGLVGSMICESGKPLIYWMAHNFSSTTDGLFGIYNINDAHSTSLIGV
jgi:hypothetical protein